MCRRRDPDRGTALTNRLKAVEDKITSIARKVGIGKKAKGDEAKKEKAKEEDAGSEVTESIFESQAGDEEEDEDESGSEDGEDDEGESQSEFGALSFLGLSDMDSQWSQ
jgi:hypothetical protein